MGNTSAQFTCAQMHDFGNCGQKFMLNSVKELPEGECRHSTACEADPASSYAAEVTLKPSAPSHRVAACCSLQGVPCKAG